ncbi:MAG: cardiolipin synthase, partial [Bacteroidota bacterium]
MPDIPSIVAALGWAPWALIPLYALGIGTAVDAVMTARTPQGATAWVFALATLPLLALPLYWILGRFRFDDYTSALRRFDERVASGVEAQMQGGIDDLLAGAREIDDEDGEREIGEMQAFSEMATLPFTRGNDVDLLIDGQETFDALFEAIEAAETYVLAQFYIVHDDEVGTRFQKALMDAAARGCEVRFLYDAIGSWKLPRRYVRTLTQAGVHVARFAGPRSWLKKLRLNFRNHRKIVVCDGRTAFVGGLNVGDEYLGRDPKIGPWRDTHLRVQGPTVQGLQLSFARDWFYATRENLEAIDWTPEAASGGDQAALVLASGPADELETCGLLYTHAIESAERRVWIATPYFVPDGRVLGALQLAALRGVDVRVLMPRTSDSLWFKWVPYAYLNEVARAGVRVFLYEPGFMHQKV